MNFKKLKVLYFNTTHIKHDDIIWGLLQLGINVERSNIIVNHDTFIESEVIAVAQEIVSYDFVITQDFCVNVAEACHLNNVPYISWIYDSPQLALHTNYAKYITNYIFSFDKIQLQILKNDGIEHVYYQPLAANVALQSAIRTNTKDVAKYSTDISFVGQLYRKPHLDTFFSTLSETEKNIFLRYCNIYSGHWDNSYSIFDNTLDDYVKSLIPQIRKSEFEYYHIDPIYVVKCQLVCPFISHFERVSIMNTLADKFNTTLYTTENDYNYAKNFFKGTLYPKIPREESYKVFKFSKLNLNVTLRTIESGIPLRVFDIMGMGGAVITNWQPEVEELFVPDKDIIVYHTINELIEKTDFYLKNEKERKSIAINGKNRILNEYNMVNSLKNMLNVL